ncbi:hypothetical protein MLD38_026808 [Melastoma candidum]|uniref:Uncharacterized protein n=1 Tax=Melastoma candidum TaxID=119954 RepID=A0ACB9P134_9MYRT|nr:hypothetical protein MLD38_026808 [Melastoma candidum]
MSKLRVPSLDGSKVTAEVPLSSYLSVWMAHWKVAKTPPKLKSNFLSLNLETRESYPTSGQEFMSGPSHVSKRDSQFCLVPARKTASVEDVVNHTINIVDETAVTVVSGNSTEEEPVPAPSPVLGLLLPGNASFTPRNERASSFSNDEAWIPLAMQRSSSNWIKGYVDGSKQLLASENSMGKKSVAVSTAFQGSQSRPSCRQMAHGLHTDGISLTLSTEKLDHHASIAISSPCNRAATSLLQNDNPPTGQERLLALLNKNHPQGFLGYHQTIPSQCSSLEAAKQETFCCGSSSRQTHHPVLDVKTMTTHAIVDSNEGLKDSQPMFSKTTHQLFFREMTDTHSSKRDQIFQESTEYTNCEGNGTFGQFLSLSLNGNYNGSPGVKLQPLWSLTDSDGHEDPVKGRTSSVHLKNESSAETNSLDMDLFPEKHLAGEASSWPKKELTRKGTGGPAKVDLRERKRKFLELAMMSSATENGESSPSETRSLEAEHVLLRDDPGCHANPDDTRLTGHHGAERRHLGMKQLKFSDTDDHHIEILKTGDESPLEKVKDLFGGILMQMKGSLETVGGNTLNEQLKGSEFHSAQSVKDGISTSGDDTKAQKGSRVLISDPWIHRWCRDQAAAAVSLMKQDPVVQCEPLAANAVDKLQRKQTPSIAAMALMGKAMNGIHPFGFNKRGSFIVWKG